MLRRASSVIGLVLLAGCHSAAAPTVEVADAPRAAPTASGEATTARRPLPPPCPDSGPVRRCKTHPNCKTPWGTTPLERECHYIDPVDFHLSVPTSVDDPCSLLALSASIQAVMEANRAHWPTLPHLADAATRYERAAEELSSAAKMLAKAIGNGDPATRESAKARLLADVPEHRAAAWGVVYTCAPQQVP